MELLVNPASYSNAVDLIKLNVHQISVGVKQFAHRNNCELNIEQIKSLTAIKNKTKILILVNKFFFEQDVSNLQTFLMQISQLNIDGIIFSDMAVAQLCFENNIMTKLIYNPDTLVCNWGQFPFYLQNNISEVSLARELNAKEIKEIVANKINMKIQLQVAGYALVMHSR
jgi:collagenase-like PrtC family protease